MKRRSKEPSARQASTAATAEGDALREQRAALAKEYRRLVGEHGAGTLETSGAALLALAAMRAGATALGAVRAGRCVVRNERWVELACGRGRPWRIPGAGEAPARGTLELAALHEAAALGAERSRVVRYERGAAEAVVEMHLERTRAGPPELVLVLISDVTEVARAERERARAREAREAQERLRAVGELASGIAHDLNNTLYALRLRLARVTGCRGDCREHRDDLRAIERIASDAGTRVRRLQDLAQRREDVPEESVELAPVIANAVEEARLDGGGSCRVAVEVDLPALPAVRANAAELRQVLVDLLVNARDAMPAGGRITVGGSTGGDGAVELAVSDEGRGIPPDCLDRIFDPFFTTKASRGAGLGLSTAAAVMRRLGGSIRAENRARGGARFTLRFPAAPAVAQAAASPVRSAPPPEPRSCRTLVVDDDPDNLEALRLVLSEHGHEVEVTASGLDAAARVEAGERYDTVVCDLGLGDTTGWEVAARIHAAAPATRILLVTGWAQEIRRDDPRRAHVTSVLPKPLGVEDLREILEGGREVARPGAPRAMPEGSRAPPPP